jgi:ABC-type transport system involved in multi-copper enzyme maturation permease subunit
VRASKVFNLNVWPVLQRELRENSRRWPNYWMRALAALLGTLVLWAVLEGGSEDSATTIGLRLFCFLHVMLLMLIGLAVPLMTADCIAREKREGTLGLLFLTPLTAMGIVLGKGMVLGLRAFTLWLSVVPLLTIPLLLGGIGRMDILRAIAAEFCVTLLCLAAGLLASSLTKSRGASVVLALLFAFCFVGFLNTILVLHFSRRTFIGGSFPSSIEPDLIIGLLALPADALTGIIFGYPMIVSNALLYSIFTVGIPLSLFLFFIAIVISAWCIKRSWQDKAPSRRQMQLVKKYAVPISPRWFSRRMSRVLDRNPIAWLQQYSWKARVTKWGLCLAFLLIECVAITGDSDTRDTTQILLLLILGAACTFVGVSSFLAEKRNGALELLLVTPIPVNKIITGRVIGLWKQFLPAALLIALCDFGNCCIDGELQPSATIPDWQHRFFSDFLPGRLTIACLFLALPFCATYFALRVKNLIVAAILTWVALLLPLILTLCCSGFQADLPTGEACAVIVVGFFGLVMLICFLLRHSLSRRIYSF